MMRGEARQKLIDGGLVISLVGLDDSTRGHLSVRDPENPNQFFMKPHSFGLDEITEENIVTCDMTGEKIAGGGRRHSEVYIHSEIYKARPDVNSVLHAHPKHCIAVSALGTDLRKYCIPSADFAEGVGMFEASRDLIRTPELGMKVAEALGARRTAFMRNHGIVATGKTIEECVFLAISLEDACEMQMLIESTGKKGIEIPGDEVEILAEKLSHPLQYEVNFDYLVRKAKRLK